MRAVLLALVCLSGCGPSALVTSASKRLALTALPRAPAQVRGSAGLGLAGRIALASPRGGQLGNGIGVPSLQPEVGSVFKFANRAYGSVSLNFALGNEARTARGDLPRNRGDFSFGGEVGLGYDFQLAAFGGIHVSGEAGANLVPVSIAIGGGVIDTRTVALPAGRLAMVPYLDLSEFRFFAGGVLSSDVWSEADSTATTCVGGGCGVIDHGRTEAQTMAMLGGGARYRPAKEPFSVTLEVWVPMTTAGVRHAPQLLIAVDVGNFDFSSSRYPAAPERVPSAAPRREPPLSPPPLPGPEPRRPLRRPVPGDDSPVGAATPAPQEQVDVR